MIAPEWPIIDLDSLRSRSWVSPTLPGKVNFTNGFGAGLAEHGTNCWCCWPDYYTDDHQFNRKCHTNAEYDNFALIHYNCRSLAKNFAMIRDHITSLDSMFDVIALSETWLKLMMTIMIHLIWMAMT